MMNIVFKLILGAVIGSFQAECLPANKRVQETGEALREEIKGRIDYTDSDLPDWSVDGLPSKFIDGLPSYLLELAADAYSEDMDLKTLGSETDGSLKRAENKDDVKNNNRPVRDRGRRAGEGGQDAATRNRDVTFLAPKVILTRRYWKRSLEVLFFHIYLPVQALQFERNDMSCLEQDLPDIAQERLIQVSAWLKVAPLMSMLDQLTDEQLLNLFWYLHFIIQEGKITEDGTVIIDGKEYDLKDLISNCCPM